MHVAERPIVESSRTQFADRRGSVVGVAALMAHVCVQNSDRVRSVLFGLEHRRQIIGDALARVAHTRDFSYLAAAPDIRLGINAPTECDHVRG